MGAARVAERFGGEAKVKKLCNGREDFQKKCKAACGLCTTPSLDRTQGRSFEGNCATSTEKYPTARRQLKTTTQEACHDACESIEECTSYDYGGESCTGCEGNCNLFDLEAERIISGGYPGVMCYVMDRVVEEGGAPAEPAFDDGEFLNVYTGNCATSTETYPTARQQLKDMTLQACHDVCEANEGCTSYDYGGESCNGCQGNCNLFDLGTEQIISGGYPGVMCYVMGQPDHERRLASLFV